MNIALIPSNKNLFNDKYFDISMARDNVLERFALLREECENKKWVCHTIDKFEGPVDVVICSRYDAELKYILDIVKKNTPLYIIYTANEPSVICSLHSVNYLELLPVSKILTWNDKAVSIIKHAEKCNIGQPVINPSKIPAIPFKDKKFCSIIIGNKHVLKSSSLYYKRFDLIKYASANDFDFDLFGVGWDKVKDSLIQKVYRGIVDNKINTIKNYRFSFCFENAENQKGLITEKIFDVFAAGSVPVYIGAVNVKDYIPASCFVDGRRFNKFSDMFAFIENIKEDDYANYLQNAKEFLSGSEYYKFTSKAFVEKIIKTINSIDENDKISYREIKSSILKIIFKNPFFIINNFKSLRRMLFDLLTSYFR